jgi:hypothetical protein
VCVKLSPSQQIITLIFQLAHLKNRILLPDPALRPSMLDLVRDFSNLFEEGVFQEFE